MQRVRSVLLIMLVSGWVMAAEHPTTLPKDEPKKESQYYITDIGIGPTFNKQGWGTAIAVGFNLSKSWSVSVVARYERVENFYFILTTVGPTSNIGWIDDETSDMPSFTTASVTTHKDHDPGGTVLFRYKFKQ